MAYFHRTIESEALLNTPAKRRNTCANHKLNPLSAIINMNYNMRGLSSQSIH